MGDLTIFESETLVNLQKKGFAMYSGFFEINYINEIKEEIDLYAQFDHPGIIKEADGITLRGIHGPHLYSDFFKKLASNEELITLAENVIGEKCYLHQFKINMKQKMMGQSWPWHEDFIYWQEKDGIAEPKLINIALLLDTSDMLSGPLCFIPYSHRRKIYYKNIHEDSFSDWKKDLSEDLNYKIEHKTIAEMIESLGVDFALGNAGDLLIFDPLVAHCSASNLSPYDRRLLILTFNAVSNIPIVNMGRPEFLCGVLSEI